MDFGNDMSQCVPKVGNFIVLQSKNVDFGTTCLHFVVCSTPMSPFVIVSALTPLFGSAVGTVMRCSVVGAVRRCSAVDTGRQCNAVDSVRQGSPVEIARWNSTDILCSDWLANFLDWQISSAGKGCACLRDDTH